MSLREAIETKVEPMRTFLVVFSIVLFISPAPAQEGPVGEMTLTPARWRAVRQVLQSGANQAGYRWAMPATISRRSFQGAADTKSSPVKDVVRELCKQTGLTAEMLNGILVVHEPNPTRLKECATQAGSKDRRVALSAICELGWLRDVRAFPALARIAVGDDTE